MADDAENDDQWLYGDQPENTHEEPPADPPPVEEPPEKPEEPEPVPPPKPIDDDKPPGVDDDEPEKESANEKEDQEDGEVQQNGEEEDLDDDSDDDVNVVIGDIKTTPSYTSLNIKRSGLLTTTAPVDKSKQPPQPGKFSVEEFDQAGMINGVPATEYNLDSLEDKPWRKPGADITDYFNYGFNEDTWRAYCERQKRMRMTESGVGLAAQMTSIARGPPPGRRMTGSIDVIGGTAQRSTPTPIGKVEPPKMNVIQVMTADRREYSRKPTGFPDMSVPPPNTFEDFQPEYGFNPEPEPFYGGYEPTQDSQWGAEGPNPLGPPPMHMGPPMNLPMPVPSPRKDSPTRMDSKERDRTREDSRARSERPRDRERERSHRRERSRSRSRRHKSRSRSPSHRHRKKKSRRHDESD
ncbi:uncharacterized protein Fip1 isoform X2 [Tribolium castaneum]|uniref:Pre-mRNA polyadenylation factor Fip1 domain-containing protein n=1 Tax=Tribolium castaneum TaxID=7070 RepID=D6WJB8_TRICA|nr:PREDICTED: pre-mRNA polyadenylation factor FIP1 isoform X2 [Tribolium castaneum]EFA03141.1 hypothetical protein TcasGA2_TC013053 [Tribolium castaneum]|eukprot:XP_967260.1 PREDICTED: pre-mRNA polyadenylation factor FIP1 isoform X2 [Tribolium castaneum]